MERPIGLVWVNAPKKPRAKSRKDENWECFRPQILEIFSNYTWHDAVAEVEKLGLTGVTVPKLRAQAREWDFHKSKVQKHKSFSSDGSSPQDSSQSSEAITCGNSSPSSSTEVLSSGSTPETFHIGDIYRVHKRKRSSSSSVSDNCFKHPKASFELSKLFVPPSPEHDQGTAITIDMQHDIPTELPDRPDSPTLEFTLPIHSHQIPSIDSFSSVQQETSDEDFHMESFFADMHSGPHCGFSHYQNAQERRAADFLLNFYCPEAAFPLYARVWNNTGNVGIKHDCASSATSIEQIEEVKKLLQHSFTITDGVEDMFATYFLTDQLDWRHRGRSITLPMKPLTTYFFDQYITKILLPGKRIPSGSLQFFNCIMAAIQLQKAATPFVTSLAKAENVILQYFQEFCAGSVQFDNIFTGYSGLKPCISWCLKQISVWENPLKIAPHLDILYGTKEGGVLVLYHHLWTAWEYSLQSCPEEHGFDCAVCGWAVLRPAETHLNISTSTLIKIFATIIIEASEYFHDIWSGPTDYMGYQYSDKQIVDHVCVGAAWLAALPDDKLALKFLQQYNASCTSYHKTCSRVGSKLKDFARNLVNEKLGVEIPPDGGSLQQLVIPHTSAAFLEETLAPSLRSSSSLSFRSFKKSGMKQLASSIKSGRSSARGPSRGSVTIDELSDTMSSVMSIRSDMMVMS